MEDHVLITTIDSRGVARLTLNRPNVRNAFNEDMIHQICDAIGRFNTDANVRAVVITGAGGAFSAGADLNMMRRAANYSPAENKDDARRLAHMLQSIYHSPKPTIALVNGPAMGGGLGLVAACDIALGAEDAFFALSEVRLGLIPAVISPFVVQAIGVRQARRYFLTGERFDAAEAETMGLLHMRAPAAALGDALEGIVGNILEGAPQAQFEAKELILRVKYEPIAEALLNDVAERIARRRASPEGQEGMEAFFGKRAPGWRPGKA